MQREKILKIEPVLVSEENGKEVDGVIVTSETIFTWDEFVEFKKTYMSNWVMKETEKTEDDN